MTLNSYLEDLASKLIIRDSEKEKIKISIETLNSRLNRYFSNIEEKFVFGSYTRGTILPRKADCNSDIDFMVVFQNPNKYKPDTMLRWLRDFVKDNYLTSEIYQSHPTIVLSLNHIKFELVPAYNPLSALGIKNYQIPAPYLDYADWISTDPVKLKEDLIEKNKNNNSKIKPLIRLLKYWNVLNGKIYSSYELENHIINQSYYFNNTSIIKMLNTAIQSLPVSYNLAYSKKEKVNNLKIKMNYIKDFEYALLDDLKKIFPELA